MKIETLKNVFWFTISLIIRNFTTVKKNRILCWSYYGKKYSCNPYYITKYLLENYPNEYEIYWAFNKDVNTERLPKQVKVVYKHTLKYCIIVNTAKFLITNCRTGRLASSWQKNAEQKYIMTWHSSMGIKKIEKDAGDNLSKKYIEAAKYDSSICDLILSGCNFRTNIIKNSFWYTGNILEKGTPRNDMLFNTSLKDQLKKQLVDSLGIDSKRKILLYAPTFRKDYSIDCYNINWKQIIKSLKQKTGDDYVILLRLHPNFINKKIDYNSLFCTDDMYDVTMYHDMQELLLISDILVTDYSSSIFDFSLLYRPCIIYAPDYRTYNRGTYFQLHQLPFPLAENQKQLIESIDKFDKTSYQIELRNFIQKVIGSFEDGQACYHLYNWMKKQ